MEPRTLTYHSAGDGEPLVLVPGGLTGWVSWIPHQEALSDHHRVIRVQPIHNELGSAGHPGDPGYNSEVERESLRLTLDALGLDQVDFAGWSAGGAALLAFAVAYPERVRSLALMEPGVDWLLSEIGESDESVTELNRYAARLAGQEVTEDDLANFLYYAGLVEDPGEARSYPAWPTWVTHRMTLSWYPEGWDPGWSLDDLARVTCPVLLFRGDITQQWLKRVVDVLAERLPDVEVVELNGDHAAHIQDMDRFLEELERHLHEKELAGP